jgi:SAM-dependent methyltransferase
MTKQHAPAAERNKDELLGALLDLLPDRGLILEVASGTGQHAVHFAPHFPNAEWQPSDVRPEALASIRAYAVEAALPNLREPVELDVTWDTWPVDEADALLNVNMLHISPWEACEGLLAGAARTLRPGGVLLTYGAMFRHDVETAPSNLAFDRSLRQRDPRWGVRQLEEVVACAEARGLVHEDTVDMPNNNVLVVFRRPKA